MSQRTRNMGLILMAIAYIIAGFNHFWHPETYLKIIPRFLPAPLAINYICGVLEIALGAMLLFNATRNAAAWGLVILLIVMFPSNIQMAYDYYTEVNPWRWAAYLRLPLQFLLMWWAFVFTDYYRSYKAKQVSV